MLLAGLRDDDLFQALGRIIIDDRPSGLVIHSPLQLIRRRSIEPAMIEDKPAERRATIPQARPLPIIAVHHRQTLNPRRDQRWFGPHEQDAETGSGNPAGQG